ncbi:MAG: YibE/F family protein [Anaerolineae bacterium]
MSDMRVQWLRWALAAIALLVLAATVQADTAGATQGTREQTLVAVVGYVADEREIQVMGHTRLIQELELVVRSGERSGEVLQVEHHRETYAGQVPYQECDLVYVTETVIEGEAPAYFVVGYVRWPRLAFLALGLIVIVVLVARQRGALALVGMAFSFLVIFVLVLPRLAAGEEPVSSALLGAALTLPISYYLAHGLNRKTTVALLGSLVGLALTGVMAVVAVDVAQLSGYASEEVGLLRTLGTDVTDVRGLLLAGLIVSMLGVLDDITVAQSAVVEQLYHANPELSWRQLYVRAMHVGQDHIASMVNTLVLVYAGAALPFLLLMSDQAVSPLYALSLEPVAEEIVRMLATSAGLVATVPITTLLAALALRVWRGSERAGAEMLQADADE